MGSNNSKIRYEAVSDLDGRDRDRAIDLLAKSFPTSNYFDLYKAISSYFCNTPKLKCLLIKKNSKIVGVHCIVDRILNYYGVECNVAGLAYLAIDPEHQRSDVISTITEMKFDYISRNADLSLGFARRAMDNYWFRYGEIGITNFCEITLPMAHVPSSIRSELKARVAQNGDIAFLSEAYERNNADLLGPFKRDDELWRYYFDRARLLKFKFMVVCSVDRPVGYYILQENTILEVGYDIGFGDEVLNYLIQTTRGSGYDEILFKIGRFHPLVHSVSKYSYSISKRYAWKGGHQAKISSVLSFITKIRTILESRISNYNIGDFEFSCNEIHFQYSDKEFTVGSCASGTSDVKFEKNEWTKLLMGASTPRGLDRFEGGGFESVMEILFPDCDTQFLEIDQF